MDRLHLLAQVVFALRLLHTILDFRLDLVAQLLHFQLFGQVLIDFFQTHTDVARLQRLLLIGRRKRGQRRGDKVHQPSRLFDVHRHGRKLVRERGRTGHDLLKQGQHVALQGFNLGILRRKRLGNRGHARAHERRKLREIRQPHALQSFRKNKQALIRHLDDFVHHRQRSDGIEIGRLRRVHPRLALRHHHDGLVVTERVNQLHRAFPPDRQRKHSMGKEHRVAHRQNGQRPLCGFIISLLGRNRIAHNFPLSEFHSTLDEVKCQKDAAFVLGC